MARKDRRQKALRHRGHLERHCASIAAQWSFKVEMLG